MVSIIYSHEGAKFKDLKIAGGFNKWEVVPMTWNSSQNQWEYELQDIPKGVKKIHFKFIDDSGNWFTDINYAKEIDEHNNENNVKMLPATTESEEMNQNADENVPATPVPSLHNKVQSDIEAEDPEEPNNEENKEQKSYKNVGKSSGFNDTSKTMINDKKYKEDEPVVTEPATTKPVVTEPVVTKSAVPEPAMHETVIPESMVHENVVKENRTESQQNKSISDDDDDEIYSADSTRVNDESSEEPDETTDVDKGSTSGNNKVMKTEEHLEEYKNILQSILGFFASWFAWLRGNAD
ncbi:Uip4p [Nakaseomyces bracarensis]|uniref:Uip4p n=1 Tax=Nakaseomyces bracarensis TaxID=273131 RepID=UPI0038716C37